MKGKEEVHKVGLGIESEDGALLTELEEVKIRWKNYFRGLFEDEVSGVDMRRLSVETIGSVADKIKEDEIRREIWKLRHGKASGVCGIQGEVLKAGGEIIGRGYMRSAIWYGGQVWPQWTGGVPSLYLYIRKAAGKGAKTTGESAPG